MSSTSRISQSAVIRGCYSELKQPILGRLRFFPRNPSLRNTLSTRKHTMQQTSSVHDIPQSRLAALLGRERPGAMEVPVAESPRTCIGGG